MGKIRGFFKTIFEEVLSMKALRYNENYYVAKGYFERNLFKRLLEAGVEYKGYSRFYVPVSKKEEVGNITSIDYIDDVTDWVHYGFPQEEAMKRAVFWAKDLNGSFIYIIDPDNGIADIKKITEIPYFYINFSKIKSFNIRLQRRLYVADFLSDTDLNIQNPELQALLYSHKNGFYIHNIVNRMALHIYSQTGS